MKFGTSGLRGLVTDLEGRATALYAQAFALHLIGSGQAKAGDPILANQPMSPKETAQGNRKATSRSKMMKRIDTR